MPVVSNVNSFYWLIFLVLDVNYLMILPVEGRCASDVAEGAKGGGRSPVPSTPQLDLDLSSCVVATLASVAAVHETWEQLVAEFC